MVSTRVGELEIARHQRQLILKPNEAHIFGMPMSVPPIQLITEGAEGKLAELPLGAFDFGLLNKEDAITLSREVEKSDINAIGYSNPVKSDFTSDISGINFTGLETNRYNIENNLGMDLSTMVADPVTGEVAFDQAAIAQIRQLRYLLLSKANSGVDTIYIGRLFLCGEVAEMGEQTITDGEGSLTWPTTVNGMVDTEFGVSVRHFFGGPGWQRVLEDAGFAGGPGEATLTITTTTLPAGVVGQAYSQTLLSTGGSGAKTWTVDSGTLPAGLTLSSAGVLSGTPTAAEAPSVTFKVADSAATSVTKALTVTVNP